MSQAASVDHPAWQDFPIRPFQIVLEGGAMRGLFSAGVLDFFLDHGLLAESVIGTSMGAVCGYNYASGATGRMAYINMKYRRNWRFMSLRSRLLTGDLVGSEFIFETIPKLEGIGSDWFTNSPIMLTSVSTNIKTGGADYHTFGKTGDVARGARYLMNNANWAHLTSPSISTIVEPVYEEGVLACQMLLDMRHTRMPSAIAMTSEMLVT